MQKTRTKDAELTQRYIITWVMRSQCSLPLDLEEKSTGTLKQKGRKESSRGLTDIVPTPFSTGSLVKMKAECLKVFLNSSPIT